jgi:hypothetical protein
MLAGPDRCECVAKEIWRNGTALCRGKPFCPKSFRDKGEKLVTKTSCNSKMTREIYEGGFSNSVYLSG